MEPENKKIAVVGIFGILAVIAIVLFVNNTLTGMYYAADDYYVRPSGMQFRVESGVAILQADVAVIATCKNAIFCENQARYTCCNHMGTECILPSTLEEAQGRCPLTHRSRCQCKEDYIANLYEKYE